MTLDELPTPCLVVDRARLEKNLHAMQEKADANDVALRPHVKTHKSLALARQQVELGAQGITVAKVGEAERFAGGGFDDIRIAYAVVGPEKLARIADLMDSTRISFCVETIEAAIAASEFIHGRKLRADVLLEVNAGHNRCGVDPDDPRSLELAKDVSALPGLRLIGILTHAGQSYHGPDANESKEEALRRVSDHERDVMLGFALRLQKEGLAEPGSFEISIGSTPSMRFFENRERDGFRITEIRPGNYVFNDAIQEGLGVAGLDRCALTVLTTIISRHRNSGRERLFADAGKKILTSDAGALTKGFGILLYNARTMEPLPHAKITGLSEEHGWIEVAGGSTLEVGNRVRLVPNHACVVVNTQDLLYVVEGDEVVDSWPVDARGAVI